MEPLGVYARGSAHVPLAQFPVLGVDRSKSCSRSSIDSMDSERDSETASDRNCVHIRYDFIALRLACAELARLEIAAGKPLRP